MPLPKMPDNLFQEPETITVTEDPVLATLRAARDSVWVIDQELSREYFRKESLATLKANVEHLKIVIESEDIKNSEHNIDDIIAAIAQGQEAIALFEGPSILNSLESEIDVTDESVVDEFINDILDEQSK